MPQTNDPTEVLYGGRRVTVKLLEPNEKGEGTETITVHFLPVRRYPDFALALGDEEEQVALFTRKTRDWIDNLHPESHDEIMRVGHELNLDFFVSWVSRRKAQQARIDPEAENKVAQMVERAVREKLETVLAPLVEKAVAALPSIGSSGDSPSAATAPTGS